MDAIQDILQAMSLAPSAHNTQPWKFAQNGQQIDVFVDWERHLDVSDPTQRQLYMSIGCALENGVVAAEAKGFDVRIELFPNGQQKEAAVARIVLQPGMKSMSAEKLFAAIPARRTDRSLYDAKPLTKEEKDSLASLQNQHVVVFENRGDIGKIADATSEGTFTSLAKKDFKQELSGWVRSSMTKQHDGMTGDSMGLPAPLALIAPYLINIVPIHKQEGPMAKKQMNSASIVIAITSDGDTYTDYINAGRLLERIWLEATAAGLAGAVHASAVETSEDLRERTQKVLDIDKNIQTLIRLGHSKKNHLRPTPRRTVAECLV